MAKDIHSTLLLLRRGPVAAKWDQAALGQADPPLARGNSDLEAAAVTRVVELEPARILTSDLRRAKDTAERIAVCANASLGVRRDLRDRKYGDWQGRQWSEIIASEQDPAVTFLHDFCRSEPPRGESMIAVSKRVVKAVSAELRRHQRDVVCYVGHAGPIRCLIAHALGLPLEAVQRMQLDPFGLSAIRMAGDASALTMLNHRLDG